MMIDCTFLQEHPATAAWLEQREKCRACASLRPGRRDKGGTAMHCAQAPVKGRCAHAGTLQYCIDARLPAGPCGPGAALFIKAEGVKS